MLQLIIAPTARAIEQGKQLIPRIRQELPKVKQQQELLELIETILVYNTIFLYSWQVSYPPLPPRRRGGLGGWGVRAINHLCHYL